MKLDWKLCLRAGVSLFVLYLSIHYWPALAKLLVKAMSPLIIGGIIAYVLNILMSKYEKMFFKRGKTAWFRRPISILGAFFTMAVIIALVVRLVVPQLASCLLVIFEELPGFLDSMTDEIQTWGVVPEDVMETLNSIDWQSRIGEIVRVVTTGLGMVFRTVSSVVSGIVTALLSLIFAIYLLAGKDKLKVQIKRLLHHYLPEKVREKVYYAVGILDDSFRRYIVGQCTEALILGVLCTVGMLLLRLPYATMIGALIAFTALIPVAGAWIGGGVGAFMLLTVSPLKALIFIGYILILQQLENNLIYPKVVGASIGLPGIWVLAAVTVGGGTLGVGGMLLGVPFAAAVYRIIQEDMARRDGQGQEQTGEDIQEL